MSFNNAPFYPRGCATGALVQNTSQSFAAPASALAANDTTVMLTYSGGTTPTQIWVRLGGTATAGNVTGFPMLPNSMLMIGCSPGVTVNAISADAAPGTFTATWGIGGTTA